MKNIIFTILEEEASNGKIIGKKLAKELKIPFYNDDIIKIAAKESGIAENVFYTIEDWKLTSIVYPLPVDFSVNFSLPFMENFVPLQDKVFLAKDKVIKEIIKDSSCVIYCKCANYMLKNNKNVVNILIYSEDEKRLKKIEKEENLTLKKAKKFLKRKEKKLTSYYSYYTSEKWDNKKQYDLLINSETIGINNAVELLKNIFKNKMNDIDKK